MAFAFAKLTKNFFKFSFSLCVRVLCGCSLEVPVQPTAQAELLEVLFESSEA